MMQEFEDYLRSKERKLARTKHLSASTIRNYLGDVAQFLAFLKRDLLASVTKQTIYNFLGSKKYSILSQHRKIVSLRTFFEWLIDRNIVSSNIPAEIYLPPKATKTKRLEMSRSSLEKFFSQIDEEKLVEIRDKCIYSLSIFYGLKPSDIVQLTVDKLDCDSGVLSNVRVKRILNILRKYHVMRIQTFGTPCAGDPLFVNVNGTKLSTRSVRRKMEIYLERANLSKEFHPMSLRHTFAYNEVRRGTKISDLQKKLGHQNKASTKQYLDHA